MHSFTRLPLLMALISLLLPNLVLSEDAAESRYISDKLYVSLRESADENSAVVASNLPSGTQLTFIEEDKANGYSKVTTSSGKEGWLKTRYLQKSPTAALKVASLEKQLSEALTKDKGDMQKELEANNARSNKIEKELAEIKHASANVVKISQQNQELIEKNQLLQSKVDSLEAVSDQKQNDESMTFFIYGGLLVLATLIINMMIDSIKRKRSYGSGGW